ncbi:MAG: anaerobic dehydrogenase, typically selenocysteine-containing, partial [Firmicutes bacterium]|nr:anaerobic dehydrogenase, typically selenocysteine-containing [Bacillota bacterium]
GAQPVQGARISRTGFAFEKTSEYKKKVAAGQNPYPSKLPWFAFGFASDNQAIFSIVNNYPYQAKILINWMANPLHSTPAAARKEVLEELKKVERVPMFISIDAFMGEMSSLADYIIPDTTQYESWGLPSIWGNFAGKATSLRWPVVIPLTPKISEGRYACYENYLIDVAKKVGLPGFGDKAIPGADNTLYPLNTPEDLYLRAISNVAFDETAVPDISKEEIELQGLAELTNAWKNSLKPDEWAKVLYVMSRGGRFEKHGSGFIGDNYKYSNPGCFNLYSEALATAKNAYTGATMLANSVLREFNKTNYVEINTEEAKRFGLTDGDKVKVISATGAETSGILKVRPGIALGTIGVAFGYGHWEYGARAHQVGDKKLGGDATIGTGILLNAICLIDPTFKDSIYGFSEMSTGIPSRNGGAYRIEKI